MKKNTPVNEQNIKSPRAVNQLPKSFLKSSKSETTLIRKLKKSTSSEKQKTEMSKNDQKVTIYCDKVGFFVQYSILTFGLKCECYIPEPDSKKVAKTGKVEKTNVKQNQAKIKSKVEITVNKINLAIIKDDVEHIFLLPSQSKRNFLKVVLNENWQLQQFHVPNKKTKISEGQMLFSSSQSCDQIYPLKNIIQADELRKGKLLKSDSKTKISWGNAIKNQSEVDKTGEKLSFTMRKQFSEGNKSFLDESINQTQHSAFLRKSFNECDNTRDSEEDYTIQQRPSLSNSLFFTNKPQKTVSINIGLWSHQTQIPKKDLTTIIEHRSKRQDPFIYKIHQQKLTESDFLKKEGRIQA